MPTYLYRTLPPEGSGADPREFELSQSIIDDPLTHDPDTGFPVQRIVTGGVVHIPQRRKSSGGGRCGSGCGCH